MKYLIVSALVIAVAFEGYYIIVLKDKISRQTEELRDISVQLQLLRREREALDEAVSSARKKAGEGKDGNRVQR